MAVGIDSDISLLMPLRGSTQADRKRLDKGTGSATFTRATIGTYIGYNWTIEQAASGEVRVQWGLGKNALRYSEDFSHSRWIKYLMVTAGMSDVAVAPNGKTTADQIIESTGTGQHCTNQPLIGLKASTTYTYSIYAKIKSGREWCNVYLIGFDGTVNGASFNLASGTIGTTQSGSSSITRLKGGWWRIAITASVGSGAGSAYAWFSIAVSDGDDDYTGDGSSGFYVWGAQVEEGSSATRYVKTDYAPFEQKGVLIEGIRTNLALYSQQLDDASWTHPNANHTANATTSPDTTVSAEKIYEDSTAGVNHQIYRSFTGTAVPYTFSIYAKAQEISCIRLRIDVGDESGGGRFQLAGPGILGSTSAGVTSKIECLDTGWYRCSITRTLTAATYYITVQLLETLEGVTNYNGDGASGCYLWGAQVEVGAYASSYIPTTSAAVQRNKDVLTVPSAGNAVDAQGTVAFSFNSLVNLNDSVVYTLFGELEHGAYLYNKAVYLNDTTIDRWKHNLADPSIYSKYAFKWSSGSSFMEGMLNGDKTSVGGTPGYDGAFLSANIETYPFGHIKNLCVWSRALTDAEMQAVTADG